MASFGSGKKVPNQGGAGKAHVAPSRTGNPPAHGKNTPGLTPDASKTNVRPKGVGGTGSTAGKPKPFK